MSEFILGLDISTSHIGVCITDYEDNIKEFANIDYSKLKELSIFDKARLFRLKMKDVFEEYNITKIYIEKPVLMFKQAASRIQIIVLLQSFNALCQFILSEMGHEPVLIPPSTAMKAALGVGRKPAHVPDKKVWTAKCFEEKHPEIELKRYVKGNHEGEIHPDMYDAIDAWLLTRCHTIGK